MNLARCMAALYLIEILHQTTTSSRARARLLCCILSKFYIKPQLRRWRECHYVVVSYRNSTSNHNVFSLIVSESFVVSYRNSTSNHNNVLRVSTSSSLYLIEILHQTTTAPNSIRTADGLYLIEILHQTTTRFGEG